MSPGWNLNRFGLTRHSRFLRVYPSILMVASARPSVWFSLAVIQMKLLVLAAAAAIDRSHHIPARSASSVLLYPINLFLSRFISVSAAFLFGQTLIGDVFIYPAEHGCRGQRRFAAVAPGSSTRSNTLRLMSC